MLIKPEGVERRLVGEILSRIESKGLTFAALELKDVSDDLARRHYAEHEDKPFFGSLLEFITSGPVVAAIVQGPRAVAAFRAAGGDVEAYPVDFRTEGRPADYVRFGGGGTLADFAVKEWLGLLAYRVVGYTHELFPAPR